MPLTQEESMILAQLRNKATGTLERLKEESKHMGSGSDLPGSLKNAVGQVQRCKLSLSEKSNQAYIYLYANTVEPSEFKGARCGQYIDLCESQYRTIDQVLTSFLKTLRSLGYDDLVDSATEDNFFTEIIPKFLDDMNKNKPYFQFNTSSRPRKDGTYTVFIQKPLPDYGSPNGSANGEAPSPTKINPPKAPKKAKEKEVPVAESSPAPPVKGPKTKGPKKAKPKLAFEEKSSVIVNGSYFDENDKEDYVGTIMKVGETTSKVAFQDGQEFDIPNERIHVKDAIQVGSHVKSKPGVFGEICSGHVVTINEEDQTCLVHFEDGDELELPLSDVEIVFTAF